MKNLYSLFARYAVPLLMFAGLSVSAAGGDITFYAMGDVPYAPDEDILLPKQIAELPLDGTFVIHVGDIKRGVVPCTESIYQKVAAMLRQSKQPLFIIPGDNEWNDCLLPNPDVAWATWTEYFMRFDQNWQHHLPVFRQLEREENFAFEIDHVLFIGINLVGGRVHDPLEWKLRHAQDLEWIHRNVSRGGDQLRAVVLFGHANLNEKHRDFVESFVAEANAFGKPILYLHGDGHTWIHDHPFDAKNVVRVQLDQGGKAPPLKVTVTNDVNSPFRFDRRNGQ